MFNKYFFLFKINNLSLKKKMNNSMFPKKPIIKKYKKRISFFSNNRINTIKFPSLFHNKFINDTIIKEKQENGFFLLFLSRSLGNNSKLFNKILYEKKSNIIFRNYFENNIKFKTRNFKLNDNLSNRKIKNFSSENVLHPNSNDSLNKIVFKKIKLKKKNNSNTLPIY